MGHGRPVDSLDSACKTYKECQKCARLKYGETCITDFVEYKVNELSGERVCDGQIGTCGRDLCMCDLAFARAHVAVTNQFNQMYWSGLGWSADDCTITGTTGSADFQCCQAANKDTAFALYNANNMICCADGSIGNVGDQC